MPASLTSKGLSKGWQVGENLWGPAMTANLELLDGLVLDHWAHDPGLSTGLTYAYRGGVVLSGGVVSKIIAGTLLLPASQTNYIERTAAGVVSSNTTSFTAGKIPMAKVTTGIASITTVADWRPIAGAGAGQVWTEHQSFTGGVDFTGDLVFNTAASQIVPGATSWSVRDNSDGFDNLLVMDNGDTTVRGKFIVQGASITLDEAVSKFFIGVTSMSFRNPADDLDVLILYETGVVHAPTQLVYGADPGGTAPFRGTGEALIDGQVTLDQMTPPSAPSAGRVSLYLDSRASRNSPRILVPDGHNYGLRPSPLDRVVSELVAITSMSDAQVVTKSIGQIGGYGDTFGIHSCYQDFTIGPGLSLVSGYQYYAPLTQVESHPGGMRSGSLSYNNADPHNGGFVYLRFKLMASSGRLFVGLLDSASVAGMWGFTHTGLPTTDPDVTDTPTGSYLGIHYSSARGDTTVKILANNGSSRTLTDTGLTITPVTKTYELYLYREYGVSGTVYYRVVNLTDNLSNEGSLTTNLPVASDLRLGAAGLYGGFTGIPGSPEYQITAVVAGMYCESILPGR